jgi:hypothetical protein
MKRINKGVPALATLVAAGALAAGLTAATKGGDDSSIQQIMDQVLSRNRAIGKRLRSPTALEAAARESMAADAASLIRLGKEARTLAEPARERKRSQQDWTRAVDNFLRASEDFTRIIADQGSGRSQARSPTRSSRRPASTVTAPSGTRSTRGNRFQSPRVASPGLGEQDPRSRPRERGRVPGIITGGGVLIEAVIEAGHTERTRGVMTDDRDRTSEPAVPVFSARESSSITLPVYSVQGSKPLTAARPGRCPRRNDSRRSYTDGGSHRGRS